MFEFVSQSNLPSKGIYLGIKALKIGGFFSTDQKSGEKRDSFSPLYMDS